MTRLDEHFPIKAGKLHAGMEIAQIEIKSLIEYSHAYSKEQLVDFLIDIKQNIDNRLKVIDELDQNFLSLIGKAG